MNFPILIHFKGKKQLPFSQADVFCTSNLDISIFTIRYENFTKWNAILMISTLLLRDLLKGFIGLPFGFWLLLCAVRYGLCRLSSSRTFQSQIILFPLNSLISFEKLYVFLFLCLLVSISLWWVWWASQKFKRSMVLFGNSSSFKWIFKCGLTFIHLIPVILWNATVNIAHSSNAARLRSESLFEFWLEYSCEVVKNEI